jgi:TonB family protein
VTPGEDRYSEMKLQGGNQSMRQYGAERTTWTLAKIIIPAVLVGSGASPVWTLAQGNQPARTAAPNSRPAETKQKTGTPQTSVGPKYLTGPVPRPEGNLGSEFLGHDIRAVVARLRSSPLSRPKSEFETTDQYAARMSAFRPSDWQYVFVLNPTANEFNGKVGFSYDADGKTLTGTVELSSLMTALVDDPPYKDGFALRDDLRSAGQYVGSNAFGVKRVVTKLESTQYAIVVADNTGVFKRREYAFEELIATVQLSASAIEAMALKANLGIALVCAVSPPRILETDHSAGATVTSPTELKQHTILVPVIPNELWLFDRRGGRVVAKLSSAATEAAPSSRPPVQDFSDPLARQATKPKVLLPVIRQETVAPKLLSKTEPVYTDEAKRAKYQGTVLLFVVIGEDGVPSNIRVLHSLGLGLDESAIECVRQWRFTPATRDGKPVAMEAQLEVNFRLFK